MRSNVLQRLDEFFDRHSNREQPVLVGFSGGPDSSALLHGIWTLKKKHSFPLIVIHVDHGWREESALEARKLKEYVESLGLSFILETLPGSFQESNLEEKAREERLAIFARHFAANRAQALVLAHQAQDQAETVLKRLFEGSHFTALGAMKTVAKFEDMVIWRPFLEIPKEELLDYCQANKIDYLLDRTNRDPRFLRARMREEMIPFLEANFGKRIQKNLARFSQAAHEMAEYVSSKVEGSLTGGPLDLSKLHPFEAKFALRDMAEKNSLKLGEQHIHQILKFLELKDGQVRKFAILGKTFIIHNGVVNLI